MENVRISVSETIDITNAIKNQTNSLNNLIRDFQTRAVTIQDWWKDKSQENYLESLNELQQRLNNVIRAIDSLSNTVAEKAKNAEETDSRLSATITEL